MWSEEELRRDVEPYKYGGEAMNAKDYLNQIRILDTRIRILEAELEAVRNDYTTITGIRLDGMPHGTGTSDPTAGKAIELINKLEQYEVKILDLRGKLLQRRIETVELIGHMEHPDLEQILYLRYVQLKRWETIAYEMGYTWRHTLRLHGTALQEVNKLLEERHVG